MGKLNLSRRTFAKLTAATAATAVVGCAVPGAALAEDAEAPSRGSEIKRVRTCCRGCGKMECGVWVTVENGRAVKVEGDQSSFQSSGNCCGKSQSSLQAAYHPDRIKYPMKRTNPKGDDDPGWVRITLDEAFEGLTLVQTGKSPHIPLVLFGTSYWQGLFDWIRGSMLAEGNISPKDVDLFTLTDDPKEAADIAMSQILNG